MASQAELVWWDKFSDIMGRHWRLDPPLNKAIRSEYMRDYQGFLFKEKGRLLEVGCGTGWLLHDFARKGMSADGLDFSESQLENARKIARESGISGVEFFPRDLVNEPLSGRYQEYDSVIINAVLHHLTPAEIADLMRRVSDVLADGGKLYVYEPLVPRMDSRFKYLLMNFFGFFIRGFFFLVRKTYKVFSAYEPEFQAAMDQGYTGTSPDEKPIDYRLLETSCRAVGLQLEKLTPYHHFSIGYGVSIIQIRNPYRRALTMLARPIYLADRLLFTLFGWNNMISRNMDTGTIGMNRAVLCGMRFRKNGKTA